MWAGSRKLPAQSCMLQAATAFGEAAPRFSLVHLLMGIEGESLLTWMRGNILVACSLFPFLYTTYVSVRSICSTLRKETEKREEEGGEHSHGKFID